MDNIRFNRCFHFLLITLLIVSCTSSPVVHRGYYFWRSEQLTDTERKFVKVHRLEKLYTRLLDVDWNNTYGPVPVSSNKLGILADELNRNDSITVEIIPVVFITNKTFERASREDIKLLAKRLVRRCLPAYDSMDIAYEKRNAQWYKVAKEPMPKEIQFDCDWTVNTSSKYFQFLNEVKSLLPSDSINISVTLRLHQFTYPAKTGVPPVNRGMLMMYNLTDPKKYSVVNSIFNLESAKPYFHSSKKYPIPLDIALPAWSWCIIYRNKTFYQIENELDVNELKKLPFLQLQSNGMYKVIRDTVYRDLFLRPGDEIKPEGIDEKRLLQAASLAEKAINSHDYTISLFELSENEIKNYSSENINKVFHRLH